MEGRICNYNFGDMFKFNYRGRGVVGVIVKGQNPEFNFKLVENHTIEE